ncbi:hypothetical protein [Undibacterium sp. JH2W]|uniref:hypothetical protein n=1 Tax=Undibacterium sp. JH2W TaxID=3413037 RepID=UPI003BF5CF17
MITKNEQDLVAENYSKSADIESVDILKLQNSTNKLLAPPTSENNFGDFEMIEFPEINVPSPVSESAVMVNVGKKGAGLTFIHFPRIELS